MEEILMENDYNFTTLVEDPTSVPEDSESK
ncbi:hypothetical protein BCD96_002096 [Clostridium beijerinckii]|nr:hypothetical protein [Clostridium beijerinckii]NOW03826.1 hypothetical protein [Clostridium beijerinckii]NRT45808.1 hypothetical protein [Clostridium beijerinckii]NRU39519.1 hypothetical protein [Clostridium beijerinckii]NRZ20191.1 hypothetical protein [Clostridium beijerinckii]